jgi:hypothetical protein
MITFFANLVAACSLPDYNTGEARRRDCVCFPGGFSIKAALCIDVYTRYPSVITLYLGDRFDEYTRQINTKLRFVLMCIQSDHRGTM